MDGLRYGSFPPRQVSFLKAFVSGKAREESAKALPLARLRPPAFDTDKLASNLGLRDHDRTIGLALRFRLAAAPLHAPIEHHHLLPFFPDSERPETL